jgi:hypothetical protein
VSGAFKARGSKVDVAAFQLYRVENGLLAEPWEVADFVTLFDQTRRDASAS